MFFSGFANGGIGLVSLPEQFFSDVLPYIESIAELKVILYSFWRLGKIEGAWHALRREDFSGDENFMNGLAKDERRSQDVLDSALRECVSHAVLLDVSIEQDGEIRTLYFLNSEKGRAAKEAVLKGQWRPDQIPAGAPLSVEKPNIFRLYEENIGALTPMVAEMLRDAEREYAAAWIEDAMRIAVAKNVRNWRYIEAILRRWKEKGRERPEQDDERERRKYVEGKYAEFIDH